MKCLPVPRPPTSGIFDFHADAPAPHYSTASSSISVFVPYRFAAPGPPLPPSTMPPLPPLLYVDYTVPFASKYSAEDDVQIYLYSDVLCCTKYFAGKSSALFNCSFCRQILHRGIWPIWPYSVWRPTA
ncbi:hypothetical protein ACOSQ3_013277 [Xanthoceras sorbifolium]